jgi:lincosamide and streptogramin A transport system ATP-binding/permease protein
MIQVSNLTFAYDGGSENIFENASFRFDTAWRLGLVGRNGRGKTTLLNLLRGKYEYGGKISAPVQFDYFPIETADVKQSAADALKQIIPGVEAWRIDRELSLLEMSGDALGRAFDTFSPGERAKILLAALFLREGNFLLIDEPTNHLDMRARRITSRYLRGKEGFILVSHDRLFLDECVDHVLSINKADIEIQRGNFSSWMKNKELRDKFEFAENERLKKDIDRLTDASRRAAGWSDKIEKSKIGAHVGDRGFIGHKSAKMMNRAKSAQHRRQSAIDEKAKLLRNVETTAPLLIRTLNHHSPRLVEFKDVSIIYSGNAVTESVTFTLGQGKRMALLGRNGSGKSSVLKLVGGENIEHTGDINIAAGLKISYVSQDTSALKGGLRAYARQYGVDESLFMAILRKLDFSREDFDKDIGLYSGGQKKKTLIARSLCESAHVYVWDEPLNFIDVFSRMQIERLINECEPTMLFVEHDRGFVDAVATDETEL